ncbi:unnamed protein product [Paramecium primaurelia]|uniref:Uncharacterized protein n=1 Tax=Paramecium primaurelia TaxID=5886 RepID=A0A8S1QM86_PARPR|nr:unnamed protein product [Paramecium primaurelia]
MKQQFFLKYLFQINRQFNFVLNMLLKKDDAKIYLQERKSGIIEKRESFNKQNVGILNDIKENLERLALNFDVFIDKIKEKYRGCNEDYSNSMKQNISIQIEIQQQIDILIKRNLQSLLIQLGNLFNSQLQQKCQQLVSGLNFGKQSVTLYKLFDIGSVIDQQTQLKTDWKCDKHEQEIVLLIYLNKKVFKINQLILKLFLKKLYNTQIQDNYYNSEISKFNRLQNYLMFLKAVLRINNNQYYFNRKIFLRSNFKTI